MRQAVSRRLTTQFAWSLVLALTAGSAFTSAQTTSGDRFRAPGRRSPSGGTVQAGSVPAISGPTWNVDFPVTNDSDSFPIRFWHSGVYDPGSNRLIVFGGQDDNSVIHNNLLLLTKANGNDVCRAVVRPDRRLSHANSPLPPYRRL